jgi:ankyrin repeat protein
MEDIVRAVQEGNEEELIRLLDADPALLERSTNMGKTPLSVAAEHGQLGVMRLLVRGGANINAPVQDLGRTALHYAAEEGHGEMVAFLLEKGAQASIRDDDSVTPLMLACENGHVGVVRMLVTHTGAQGLEVRDRDGKTALRCAAEGGHGEVVAFLLGKGAQASTRDDENVTPLMMACDNGHLDVIRMLVQHTGGERLDARDEKNDWTALHGAAFYGHEKVVRFLLFAGADLTIMDKKGRTAHALATLEQPEHVDMHEELWARCARCVALFKVRAHVQRTTWRPPLSGLDSMTS